MAPLRVCLVALLLAALSIGTSSAFPARFVNALASNGNPITLKLATQDQTYSCTAALSASCDLGDFGVLTDVQATATDSNAQLLFNSTVALLNQVRAHFHAVPCAFLKSPIPRPPGPPS